MGLFKGQYLYGQGKDNRRVDVLEIRMLTNLKAIIELMNINYYCMYGLLDSRCTLDNQHPSTDSVFQLFVFQADTNNLKCGTYIRRYISACGEDFSIYKSECLPEVKYFFEFYKYRVLVYVMGNVSEDILNNLEIFRKIAPNDSQLFSDLQYKQKFVGSNDGLYKWQMNMAYESIEKVCAMDAKDIK